MYDPISPPSSKVLMTVLIIILLHIYFNTVFFFKFQYFVSKIKNIWPKLSFFSPLHCLTARQMNKTNWIFSKHLKMSKNKREQITYFLMKFKKLKKLEEQWTENFLLYYIHCLNFDYLSFYNILKKQCNCIHDTHDCQNNCFVEIKNYHIVVSHTQGWDCVRGRNDLVIQICKKHWQWVFEVRLGHTNLQKKNVSPYLTLQIQCHPWRRYLLNQSRKIFATTSLKLNMLLFYKN